MILKQLRDAAMQCSNVDYRSLLRGAADLLETHITVFSRDPTANNLIGVNGAWSYSSRILANVPPEAPPAPTSGDTEPARLAA